MRIVCPKCELKGQVDIVPAGARTRIACVRCATTFDAVFVDGEIQALLPKASRDEATIESGVREVHAVDDVSAAEAEAVSMPETPHESMSDASLQGEATPVEVDDLSTSSADLLSESADETEQAAPQEVSQELTPQDVESHVIEPADVVQPAADASAEPFKLSGAGKVSRPPSDAYGMGVRLMRVSPVWLLLAGLSFISFIVFCNWLIKPAEQAGDAARPVAAANNRATNQSTTRANVPTSTAQSPVNSQIGQPSNQPGVAFISTEAKEAMPPVAAPSVESVGAKAAVEEKPAIPASSSNGAGGAKEGKVTIQVGSYNAASEADARVATLRSAGFDARSVEVEIPKRGTWYRVQSGRFVSRDEAERYGKQLRDKGVVSSFITTDVRE
ncbi:MAG TPA: SPOR domain-containing protein [Pyrinomonadaceae bacterium]|nr:SPOR domain-containing protein [Pyrinomonadaceae bacterium]